jgi:hypothetical protein
MQKIALRGEPLVASSSSFATRLDALKKYLVACVETCADYYEAATLYDALSGLSDAELHRCGLSRDTLARDITQACDRTNDRRAQ